MLAAAVGVTFHPVLGGPLSILGNDSLTHSLPAHHVVSQLTSGAGFRFWRPDLALGYPAYADGAGGVLHPLKLALFALFDWLVAHDLVYVVSCFLSGAFALGTARTLGLAPELALVAALLAGLSPAVVDNIFNASLAHSTAWSAGALFAFERFERRPGVPRFLLLALALALLLLAGYMPTAYATLVFLAVLVTARYAAAPRVWLARAAALGGALVLALCLAAFQILPLVELALRSDRQQALAALEGFTWAGTVVGLFVVNDPDLYRPGGYLSIFSATGSVVALLAVAWLPWVRGRTAASYAVAVLFCVGIASGPGAPLYELARRLLPGLDRLRLISPFLLVTIVPIALGIALATDARLRGEATRRRRVLGWLLLAFALFLLLASRPFAEARDGYRMAEAGLLVLAAGGFELARRRGHPRLAVAAVVTALLGEALGVRAGYPSFHPDAVLGEARPLADVLRARSEDDPEARVAYLWGDRLTSLRLGFHRHHRKQADYATLMRETLRFGMPDLNLLARANLVDSHDPLPLREAVALREPIQHEITGRAPRAPGARWLDRFRVRWVVAHASDLRRTRLAPDLRVVWRDPASPVVVLENPNAAPRDSRRSPRARRAWRRSSRSCRRRSAARSTPCRGSTPSP